MCFVLIFAFHSEGTGGRKGGRECKFQNKAHGTFDIINTSGPVGRHDSGVNGEGRRRSWVATHLSRAVQYKLPSERNKKTKVMGSPRWFLLHNLSFGALLFSGVAFGQQGLFLQHYMGDIQNYIMTGREMGWRNCDILSANSYSYEDVAQITMDFDKIQTLNLKSAFSSSDCLLVVYDVSSKGILSSILKFGWAAFEHVRLALVIKMDSGITLDMATNTSKLPFLVAAESDKGKLHKEQFLCPVVGESEPHLEQEMCKPSSASYRNKILRIALAGLPPHFVMTSNGTIEGTIVTLIKILAKKLRFTPKIIIAESFIAADLQVCI